MPIQISELNITVSVNQPGPQQTVAPANPEEQQQSATKLIDECVGQVMKILQDKKER
jgi:hypothetical protein